MDNQQPKRQNAQKYFLEPNKIYGNYQTIKIVEVPIKTGIERRWECIHLPTSEIKIMRSAYLAKFKTKEESDLELQELVKNNLHQPGLRNYLFRYSKENAARRNHDFVLSFEDFNDLIMQNCFYCNEPPRESSEKLISDRGNSSQPPLFYNGIDRIDSNLGYIKENCVPCCPTCNYMKRILSKNEFYYRIKKIYEFLDLGSTTIPEGSTSQANGDGNGGLLTDNAEDEDIV